MSKTVTKTHRNAATKIHKAIKAKNAQADVPGPDDLAAMLASLADAGSDGSLNFGDAE